MLIAKRQRRDLLRNVPRVSPCTRELEPIKLLSVCAFAQALLYSRREYPRDHIASTPAVLHTRRHNTIIKHKTGICELADLVRWIK